MYTCLVICWFVRVVVLTVVAHLFIIYVCVFVWCMCLFVCVCCLVSFAMRVFTWTR